MAGCSGDKSPEPAATEETAAARPASETVEGIRINTATLDAWLNLVAHVEAGETLRETDCAALLALPGYQILYNGQTTKYLNPGVLLSVIDYVFSPRSTARTPKRTDLVSNYEYLSSRRDRARNFAQQFTNARFQNHLLALATPFLGDVLPDPLTIHPVAASTSIGFQPPGDLSLDIGLAYAAGQELAARLCASRLWDALKPLEGLEPHATANGTLALAATFRKLNHRAIYSWIAGTADPEFDFRHAGLGSAQPRIEDNNQRAVILCTRVQAMLRGQLGEAGASLRAEHGGDIDSLLRLHSGYEILGYAMGDLIVRHGGVEELAAVTSSPAAFLSAYQAAATDSSMITTLPAFDTVQLEQLVDFLGK